jgi:hypothetical protein
MRKYIVVWSSLSEREPQERKNITIKKRKITPFCGEEGSYI